MSAWRLTCTLYNKSCPKQASTLQLTNSGLQLQRCSVDGSLTSFCCVQVDFHSVFWHAKELGIDIVRCPVST